jgi:large subunit ribosomal protein L23
MKDAYQIIERPLLTEKSMDQSALNKYTFRVAKDANKIEIADAIEQIFQVKVTKVNTLTVKGKKKRVGRFPQGKTADWKKAVVTVADGQTITLFEGI